MHRKSTNIIEGLLFVWKGEILQNKIDGIIIPFVLKKDIEAYKHRNKSKNVFHFSLKMIKFLLKALIKDQTVSTKEIEEFLSNQKNYFLIKEDQVSLYQNNILISTYALKDITIKPTLYDALIYSYYITCPNLTLGECYVLVEDSLTLKNSFTFLGRPSYDDLEDDENNK